MLLQTFADPKIVEDVNKVNDQFHQISKELFLYWKTHMLFEWHWWGNLVILILPWVVWLMVRDRKNTVCLLLAAVYIMVVCSFYDALGMALGLWGYNYKLIPLIPPFIPWDVSAIPVAAMIFFQFARRVKPFFKGLIYAFTGAYLSEPFFYWLGFYNPKAWKHIYSFPIILFIYYTAYFIYPWACRQCAKENIQRSPS